MKIISFRATNFRGFVDTGHIKLKSINLLVGKNSIGKSSYARLWPIFNQGAKLQKRTPILWNGDLVDFGTYKNILYRNAKTNEVTFDFQIEIEKRDLSTKGSAFRYGGRVQHLKDRDINFKINLTNSNDDVFRTRCSEFTLTIEDVQIKYVFGVSGLLLETNCGNLVVKPGGAYSQENTIGFLIPLTEYFIKVKDVLVPAWSPMHMRLFSYLRGFLHQRLSDERVREICTKLNVVGSESELLNYCDALPYQYKTWRDFLDKVRSDVNVLRGFHTVVIMATSELLLKDVDLSLRQYFSTVNYIRPLRATAERYYRKKDLSVDNIDSEGSNLAFFLASLSKDKLSKLNEWLTETLDIKVEMDSEKGHVMVNLFDQSTGRLDNMADMGFGFSQVLPLAVQAWVSSSPHARIPGRISYENTILVWEQPELHLHPAMQRKLARLIAKTTTVDPKKNITFIIETHSQSMVNEIGDLIVSNEFNKDDVQILLFEQRETFETEITKSNYDDDGQLTEWPYGFLSV